MEPIIVRKAQQADIPAILEIEWECFREDSFSKEQFAYLISRSKGIFYVMMEADRVIAYVSLLFHGGTRYLRIYSIAVHPDYRGRELGQVLMDQTIQTAGECKAAKITLEVKVTNTSAIGLYMKNEVVSKRWHNLFYILQFCYIFFWLCCFFLMHLATSCYIPIISGYK